MVRVVDATKDTIFHALVLLWIRFQTRIGSALNAKELTDTPPLFLFKIYSLILRIFNAFPEK